MNAQSKKTAMSLTGLKVVLISAIIIGLFSQTGLARQENQEADYNELLKKCQELVVSNDLTQLKIEDFSISDSLFSKADSLLLVSIRQFNKIFARQPFIKYNESKESQHVKIYEYFLKNSALIDSAQAHCEKALHTYEMGTKIRRIEHKIRDEENTVLKKIIQQETFE